MLCQNEEVLGTMSLNDAFKFGEFFSNINCSSSLEFVDYAALENTFVEHSFSIIFAFK